MLSKVVLPTMQLDACGIFSTYHLRVKDHGLLAVCRMFVSIPDVSKFRPGSFPPEQQAVATWFNLTSGNDRRATRQDDAQGEGTRTGLHDADGLGKEGRPCICKGAYELLTIVGDPVGRIRRSAVRAMVVYRSKL